MTVFRFTPEKYSGDISGEGARLFGGRWNSIGFPIVYTSINISLSLLEILIYSASYDQINNNFLVRL
ncbi:MAG: RES family NAD+ phosphorylase, partial [Chitinophagaceae bacterium]